MNDYYIKCILMFVDSPSPSPSTEILLVKTSFPVWLIVIPVVLSSPEPNLQVPRTVYIESNENSELSFW